MKKSYIIPSTLIVKVATTRMIAQSLRSLPSGGGDVKLETQEAGEGSYGMSRGGSLWGDDDY